MTEHWRPPVDLDNCAAEPIHVPGAIQPHGVLLAVTEPAFEVAVASGNLSEWFGIAAGEAIGRDLADVLGAAARREIERGAGLDWVQRYDELTVPTPSGALIGALHRSGGLLVVELERPPDPSHHAATIVREAAMALQASRSAVDVADAAARWIRALTGFDRTMVYRFDADWNGEVIAEHKRDDLNTFLGLHYPASDIPAQARELYRTNWLRMIPDVTYAAVELVPPVAHTSRRPLDLSASTLRSVSPIHVEYLSNMGVRASMSVSIVIGGELWGLVACHHYSGPLQVAPAARNAAEFLGQLISLRIAETTEADARALELTLGGVADQVAQALAGAAGDRIGDVLAAHGPAVLGLARAQGAFVRVDDVVLRIGVTPPEPVIRQIVAALPDGAPLLVTDELAEVCPEAAGFADVAAGLLAVALTDDRREVAMWFRPERVRTVGWGGDPHNAKLAEIEGDSVRLSPRKSFERWQETVRGRADPWFEAEVRAAQRFARDLAGAMLREQRDSAALARDLQRAMRPGRLPHVDGFELSVFAESAGRGEIGGDWYDVLPLADGKLALVVGDVAGHGLRAASEMAQLRNVLRAYLADEPRPANALERLDAYMRSSLRGSIATAVCAVVDTATATVTLSHAGHVPALLLDHRGATYVQRHGDVLLGFAAAERTERSLLLEPGAAVVLFTDGLVETRQMRVDVGLEALRAAAAADPGATAEHLARTLIGDHHEDDVTVLVLRRS